MPAAVRALVRAVASRVVSVCSTNSYLDVSHSIAWQISVSPTQIRFTDMAPSMRVCRLHTLAFNLSQPFFFPLISYPHLHAVTSQWRFASVPRHSADFIFPSLRVPVQSPVSS